MTDRQFKIEWKASPNFTKGRGGKKIVAIVTHITAGQFPGCLSWLCNPASRASSNYLITRTGRIVQLVRDEDTAWANGVVNKPSWGLYDGTNPNRYTVSIEHEGYGSNGGDGNLTESQYQASLWLHKQLIKKHNLPIDRDHIIGHFMIDSVNRPNCPGENFPWVRLFNDLKGSGEVPEWKRKLMDRAHELGLIDKSLHKPDETASKWFVLAVIINLYDKLKGGR